MADKSKASFMDIMTAKNILKKLDSGKNIDIEKDLIEKMLSIKNEEKRVEIMLDRAFLKKIRWFLEDEKFLKRAIESISDIDLRVEAILGLNNDKAFEFLIELDNDQVKIDLLKKFSDKNPNYYFNYDRLFNSINSDKDKIDLLFNNLNLAKCIFDETIVDLIRTLDDYNERFKYLIIIIKTKCNKINSQRFDYFGHRENIYIKEILDYIKNNNLDPSKIFDEDILDYFTVFELLNFYSLQASYELKEKFWENKNIREKIKNNFNIEGLKDNILNFIKESNNENLIIKLFNCYNLSNIDDIILEKNSDKIFESYINLLKENYNIESNRIAKLINAIKDDEIKFNILEGLISKNIVYDEILDIIASINDENLKEKLLTKKNLINELLRRINHNNDYILFENLLKNLVNNNDKEIVINLILNNETIKDDIKFNLLNILFNSITDDKIKENYIAKNRKLQEKKYLYLLKTIKDDDIKLNLMLKYYKYMINKDNIFEIIETDKKKIEFLFSDDLKNKTNINVQGYNIIPLLLSLKSEENRYQLFFKTSIIDDFLEYNAVYEISVIFKSFKNDKYKLKALDNKALINSKLYNNKFVTDIILTIEDDELKEKLLLNENLLKYLDKEQILNIFNSLKDENIKWNLMANHPYIFQQDTAIISNEGINNNKEKENFKIEIFSDGKINVIQFLNDEIFYFKYDGTKMSFIRYNVNSPKLKQIGIDKERLFDEFNRKDIDLFKFALSYYGTPVISKYYADENIISEKNINLPSILNYIALNGLESIARNGLDEIYNNSNLQPKKFESPKIDLNTIELDKEKDSSIKNGDKIQEIIDQLKELKEKGIELTDEDKEFIAKYDGRDISTKLSKEDIDKLEAFRNRTTKKNKPTDKKTEKETNEKDNKKIDESKKTKQKERIAEEIEKNKRELNEVNNKIDEVNKKLDEAQKKLSEKQKQIKTIEELIENMSSNLIDEKYLEQLEKMKEILEAIKHDISSLNNEIISLKEKQKEISTEVQYDDDYTKAMSDFSNQITKDFEKDTEMDENIRNWYINNGPRR